MHPDGPRVVLVTSLRTEQTQADTIELMAFGNGQFHLLRTPALPIQVNGAGDVIAALFLYHFLASDSAVAALEASASSLHGVLRRTAADGARELSLVAAQAELVSPAIRFGAQAC